MLNSKWTAVTPAAREKHFLVTEVEFDEQGGVIHCVLEAVLTGRSDAISWQSLKNEENWLMGWRQGKAAKPNRP